MRVIVVLLFFTSVATPAKILGIFPAPSLSHQITFQPIWRELARRGHEVTVITPNPIKDKTLKNLREIDIHDISYTIWNKHNISSLGVDEEVESTDLSRFLNLMAEMMDAQAFHPEVYEIITNKDNKYKFDLLMVEFMMPFVYPVKDVYNCHLVAISSMPLQAGMDILLGNPYVPASNPDPNLPFARNLTFLQRAASMAFSSIGYRLLARKFEPVMRNISRHIYGPDARSTYDIAKETSMVFANVNPVLQPSKANVPAIKEFSGIHITTEKPLPKDLKTYLDDAKEGVIYMSLGSNIKSSAIPPRKLALLLDTFAELPYKVLWKFETDLKDKPKNVEIRKWLPQQDVLRHKNVRLFITQGGLQSLDEAMYTKTPVVVIPFFGDQFGNSKKIEDVGMGKSLRFAELDKNKFKAAILEVLDKKYAARAEELHDIVTDQPMSALDTAVFWIEFVLRHKGASHLRSPAIDLEPYQNAMLDVIGAATLIVLVALFVLYKATKCICRLIFCRKQRKAAQAIVPEEKKRK